MRRLRELFFKLTGGRPMKVESCAFVDRVNHREVFRFTDRLGRQWLAQGLSGWAIFRVRV